VNALNALLNVQNLLLVPTLTYRLRVEAALILIDAALQPKPATNASALRLTLADEPNGPQIAPETP
jgi:hypothetical protein